MGGWTPISPWKLGKAQVVAYTGTSAASTAVGNETRAILVYASSSCHIRIGQPTQAAVASDTFLPGGGSPLVLGCSPGDVVAAIQDSTGGNLFVTELSH